MAFSITLLQAVSIILAAFLLFYSLIHRLLYALLRVAAFEDAGGGSDAKGDA